MKRSISTVLRMAVVVTLLLALIAAPASTSAKYITQTLYNYESVIDWGDVLLSGTNAFLYDWQPQQNSLKDWRGFDIIYTAPILVTPGEANVNTGTTTGNTVGAQVILYDCPAGWYAFEVQGARGGNGTPGPGNGGVGGQGATVSGVTYIPGGTILVCAGRAGGCDMDYTPSAINSGNAQFGGGSGDAGGGGGFSGIFYGGTTPDSAAPVAIAGGGGGGDGGGSTAGNNTGYNGGNGGNGGTGGGAAGVGGYPGGPGGGAAPQGVNGSSGNGGGGGGGGGARKDGSANPNGGTGGTGGTMTQNLTTIGVTGGGGGGGQGSTNANASSSCGGNGGGSSNGAAAQFSNNNSNGGTSLQGGNCTSWGGGGGGGFYGGSSGGYSNTGTPVGTGGSGGGGGGSSYLQAWVYPLSNAGPFISNVQPTVPSLRRPGNHNHSNGSNDTAHGYAWIMYLGARSPMDPGTYDYGDANGVYMGNDNSGRYHFSMGGWAY